MHTRFLLFVAVSVFSFYLAFFLIPVEEGQYAIILLGYPTIAGIFFSFLFNLYSEFNERSLKKAPDFWEKAKFPLLVSGLSLLVLISYEPFQHKILYDELLLSATAKMIHLDRLAALPQTANSYTGAYLLQDAYLDKRPVFFPFLISLIHDLTGYRVGNVHILNVILSALLIGQMFFIQQRLTNTLGAVLTCILLAGSPLFGVNVNGGHFEILNLVMIFTCILLAFNYSKQLSKSSLNCLIGGLVLLCFTRYENAIYIIPFGILILRGWIRKGTPILSAMTFTAPIVMVLYALQYRLTNAYTEFYWQTGYNNREATFSLNYFQENLAHAFEYLYFIGKDQSNHLLVSILGTVALIGIVLDIARRLGRQESLDSQQRFFLFFFAIIAINFGLIMVFNWGVFTNFITSRFSLPLQALMMIAIPFAIVRYQKTFAQWIFILALFIGFSHVINSTSDDWFIRFLGYLLCLFIGAILTGFYLNFKKYSYLKTAVILASILFLAYNLPKGHNHRYTQYYNPIKIDQNEKQFLKEKREKTILWTAISHYNGVLYDQHVAPIWEIARNPSLVETHLNKKQFHGIYASRRFVFNRSSQSYEPAHQSANLSSYELETVFEERINPESIHRIDRILGIK